jgi:hypothetical protein
VEENFSKWKNQSNDLLAEQKQMNETLRVINMASNKQIELSDKIIEDINQLKDQVDVRKFRMSPLLIGILCILNFLTLIGVHIVMLAK